MSKMITKTRASTWPDDLWAFCASLRDKRWTWKGIAQELTRLAGTTDERASDHKRAKLFRLDVAGVPNETTISRRGKAWQHRKTTSSERTAQPLDREPERRSSRDPAFEGHLKAILGGLTSGLTAGIMNIESPANVIGYGPGNVRIRKRTEAFWKWASSRQMVHAAEHAFKLDIPAELERYRTAVDGYIEAMKILEDRAIDQARALGLVSEQDECGKQGTFTDDFWGVPLRWAVGTRLGHRIEVPRATVVHDNPGGESAGGGLYRLYWLYDSSMRSIAASESREVMSKAESAFLAWGDRWLRGAGITALSDSFHRAQAVMQRLHEVILSLTVDDLAEGRCTDCPSTA